MKLQRMISVLARRKTVAILAAATVSIAPTAYTMSAFSSKVTHPSNYFASGTVILDDNVHTGATLFNISNIKPGDVINRCVNVAYTGTLAAKVKTYATGEVAGDLADYLTYTVEEGTYSSAPSSGDSSCTNFTRLGSNYSWGSGALNAYPATYSAGHTGVGNPDWTNPTTKAVRISVTLPDGAGVDAAQGKSTTMSIFFEAQNT